MEYKKYIFTLLILLVVCLYGCGGLLIYDVAVDERKTGTIVSDEVIAVKIRQAFVMSGDVKLRNMSTFCYRGCVYLVGEQETEEEKERAIEIANAVKGVISTEVYLLPKQRDDLCKRSNDLSLNARVKAKLIRDKDISSLNIQVRSIHCRVVLLGILSSQKEIDKAIAAARSTKGVREVISFLQSPQQLK
ncbi:MAG: BON domain-containing protein [Syntrophales bacterium LBB04]|nr:BON domain-containing protein [Syntrophales bacterium LBB04]